MNIRTVTYGELRVKDKRRLKELMSDFVARQGISPITDRDIRRTMSRPEHTLVVAMNEEGDIMGVIALVEMNIFTGRIGLIEEVATHPRYRGKGIATAILKEAIRIARKKQMKSLKLNTNTHNIPANKLYERLGFTRKDDYVYKLAL